MLLKWNICYLHWFVCLIGNTLSPQFLFYYIKSLTFSGSPTQVRKDDCSQSSVIPLNSNGQNRALEQNGCFPFVWEVSVGAITYEQLWRYEILIPPFFSVILNDPLSNILVGPVRSKICFASFCTRACQLSGLKLDLILSRDDCTVPDYTYSKSTSVVDCLNSGMGDTWRLYSGTRTELSPAPDHCGMKGILCWRWSMTSPRCERPSFYWSALNRHCGLSSLKGRAAAPGLLSAWGECGGRVENGNAVVCDCSKICRRFDSGIWKW